MCQTTHKTHTHNTHNTHARAQSTYHQQCAEDFRSTSCGADRRPSHYRPFPAVPWTRESRDTTYETPAVCLRQFRSLVEVGVGERKFTRQHDSNSYSYSSLSRTRTPLSLVLVLLSLLSVSYSYSSLSPDATHTSYEEATANPQTRTHTAKFRIFLTVSATTTAFLCSRHLSRMRCRNVVCSVAMSSRSCAYTNKCASV